MTYEDFTDPSWIEEDPNNHWSQTATRNTAAGVSRDETCYVYKDYGVGHFDECEHLFDINCTNVGNTGSICGYYGQSNTKDELLGWASGYCIRFYYVGVGDLRLYLYDRSGVSDFAVSSAATPYYCTIKRFNDTDLTLKIYSDAARTVLEDTLEVALIDDNQYRYMYCGFSQDTGNALVQSGYLENLDIKEAPCTVSTGAASSIAQTTADLEGTLDAMGNETSVDVTFEYGETAAYGDETTGTTETETGDISEGVEDLTASTTYHFRIKAVGTYGTAYGSDADFDTLAEVVAAIRRRAGRIYGLKPSRVVNVGRIGV